MYSVAEIFNDMKDEYEDLQDPWYSWLYSRLHYLIAKTVIRHRNPATVLDIGCGTGFQSYLHAAAGSRVVGIDAAHYLISKAKEKVKHFNYQKVELFPVYFDYVARYNRIIKEIVCKSRGTRSYTPPRFLVGDATQIPYEDCYFDHVNCCGAVLNFIPEHQKAIAEIARVLKPDGTFFMEIDGRWNLDAIWAIVDPLLRQRLGLNPDIEESMRLIRTNPFQDVKVNFLFRARNKPILMKLNLFTNHRLTRILASFGLKVEQRWSIHSITNLIPSSFLDSLRPSSRVAKIFQFLARLEERLPFYLPGSSIVYYGRKIN